VAQCDYLIIGSGIIGVNITRVLSARYSIKKIIVIDKESEEAQHASGRNIWVLNSCF
jgi:(S)-2-hydroxyglutarate dehydrogenase